MSITIVRGTNNKPVSSQELLRLIRGERDLSGNLFVGYPIIGTSEGRHPIDALLVSPDKGIVIFDLIEGSDPGDYEGRQDDSANKLEARLKVHRELMRRRDLLVPIYTVSFAPGLSDLRDQRSNDPISQNSFRSRKGVLWRVRTSNRSDAR